MRSIRKSPEEIQREYYAETASRYNAMHVSGEDHEHLQSLNFIYAFSEMLGAHSFLDVGAGTGRGIRFFIERNKFVLGIEPVEELITAGIKSGLPNDAFRTGTGYDLPFEDSSFDVVFECGVLHHVARPEIVVREMLRVAKKAVFLSDANRYGKGSEVARLVKLFLYKSRLWTASRFLQTGGKMYCVSEGDGLYYSYSVYDSFAQLAGWTDDVFFLPVGQISYRRPTFLHPLLTSSTVLACALRKYNVSSGLCET